MKRVVMMAALAGMGFAMAGTVQAQRPISQFANQDGPGCPHPGRHVSPRSSDRATVIFTNRADRAVNVYWLDFQGQPREYAALLPGQSYTINTFVGHLWIAKAQDRTCFGGLHAIRPGRNEITLR
jgi:hypothetical protein